MCCLVGLGRGAFTVGSLEHTEGCYGADPWEDKGDCVLCA
jgi:hypothetical protein